VINLFARHWEERQSKRSGGDAAERHREALPVDLLVQAGRLAVGDVIA
jgi:hypothetical protein